MTTQGVFFAVKVQFTTVNITVYYLKIQFTTVKVKFTIVKLQFTIVKDLLFWSKKFFFMFDRFGRMKGN